MNNSRVLPARLYGVRPETGGHVEVLLLRQDQDDVGDFSKPHVNIQLVKK